MTRPFHVAGYPDEIIHLSTHFEENPKRILEVPFETKNEAQNFRLSFYSFRSAAFKRDGREALATVFPRLEGLRLRIVDDPPRVIVDWVDPDDLKQRIAAALDEAKAKEKQA